MIDLELDLILDSLYDLVTELEERISLGYDPSGNHYRPKLKQAKYLIKRVEAVLKEEAIKE